MSAAFLLLLVACGGGGGGSPNNSTAANNPNSPATSNPTQNTAPGVSGNWQFNATSTASGEPSFILAGGIVADGRNITGSFIIGIGNPSCTSTTQVPAPVPFSGSEDGSTITFTTQSTDGQVISATLSIARNGDSASGTYSITGTGCMAGDKGTLSGNKIPPVTGLWKGTLTSKIVSCSGTTQTCSSTSADATAQITQDASPSADGLFHVTGTLTLSGSTCFNSITISIAGVAGNIFVLLANTSPDSATLALTALTNTAATSMTGAYSVKGGSCDGGSGDLTLTRQ